MYIFMHMTKDIDSGRIGVAASRPVILLLALLLAACASAPKPSLFTIRGDGDQILNRDINGKSLSVVVRIYQLKDAREFSKLTFDTLASGHSESDLLGPALLDKTDVILVPGGSYVNSEKLLDDTRFVGIVAFFRNPDPYYWRQLVEAAAISKPGGVINDSPGLTFRVQDCYILLTSGNPVLLPGQPPNTRPDCGASNAPGTRPDVHLTSSTSNRPAAQRATAPAGRGQKAGWLPPSVPEISVNTATPLGPVNTQIGGGGINAITIGEPSPVPTNYNAPY